MKITDRLSGDHKTFRKMIDDLAAIIDTPPEKRDKKKLIRLVELFKDHILIHAWFEDRFYYPAVSAALAAENQPRFRPGFIPHLMEEHKTVDGYLDRLEREVKTEPPAPFWPQTAALFMSGLRVHMKREEEDLFPASEVVLGTERLESLAKEMETRRAEAPRVSNHAALS